MVRNSPGGTYDVVRSAHFEIRAIMEYVRRKNFNYLQDIALEESKNAKFR